MVIVFIGPPYSGKGTQARLLGQKLNISVFSMGDLIKEAYYASDPKAVEGFQKYSLKGLHLPIHLKFYLLRKKIDKLESFILDNFPATKEDLETFLKYVDDRSLSIDKVFYMKISQEEMLKRMSVNRSRPDDTKEIVLKRRKIQDEDRIPVVNYFKRKGLLVEINAENPIEEVEKEIINSFK